LLSTHRAGLDELWAGKKNVSCFQCCDEERWLEMGRGYIIFKSPEKRRVDFIWFLELYLMIYTISLENASKKVTNIQLAYILNNYL